MPKLYSAGQLTAVLTRRVVETRSTIRGGIPPPGPTVEILFKRARAKVSVEIAVPFPLPTTGLQIHLDIATWSERSPDMSTIFRQGQLDIRNSGGRNGNGAVDTRDQGKCTNFIDFDCELPIFPKHSRRPNR